MYKSIYSYTHLLQEQIMKHFNQGYVTRTKIISETKLLLYPIIHLGGGPKLPFIAFNYKPRSCR